MEGSTQPSGGKLLQLVASRAPLREYYPLHFIHPRVERLVGHSETEDGGTGTFPCLNWVESGKPSIAKCWITAFRPVINRKEGAELPPDFPDAIVKHFDREGATREILFAQDPILGYEQEARQRSINGLLDTIYRQALDAGCGNGRDLHMLLARSQRVVACDLSEVMIKGARERVSEMSPECRARVRVDRASVTDLPYADNTFDLIVCSEVLEHVPNWLAALNEFERVLEPGGSLIISTPNKLSMYGLTRYPGRFLLGTKHAYDRWRIYWEHRSALKHAGFQLREVRGACYLIGDLSYLQPFRWFVTRTLPWIRWAEQFLSRMPPFKFVGYMIVLKAQKPTDIGR